MTDIISKLLNESKTQSEFKEKLEQEIIHIPGSERVKKMYKYELFKELVINPTYRKLREIYLIEKKAEKKERLIKDAYIYISKLNPDVTEQQVRDIISSKETELGISNESKDKEDQKTYITKPSKIIKQHYASVSDIIDDFIAKSLIGKTPGELSQTNSKEYRRVYKFAKLHNLKISDLWIKIGMDVKKEQYDRTLIELATWSATQGFGGKHISEITTKSKTRIKSFAKNNNIEFTSLCEKLGIKTHVLQVYYSIDEIKSEIKDKGYVGKKPMELPINMKSNIRRFAQRNGYNIVEIWNSIGIVYSDKLEIRDGKVGAKFAYNSIDDIKKDITDKKLLGANIKQLDSFDGGKTQRNIYQFAKRNNISMNEMYEQVGIKHSHKYERANQKINIFSIEDINQYLEKMDPRPKDIISLRMVDKLLYKKILDYAKQKKMERGEIWGKLNMNSSLLFLNSIDDIINLLKTHNLLGVNVKYILDNHRNIYNQISSYANKNNLKTTSIWKTLGIKNQYEIKGDAKE